MATLFVSDLHLAPERPWGLRLFRTFLAGPARGAEALYILGDLVEYWAGDDDRSAFNTSIVQALAECAERVPVTFMRGNRDFLIGERFARETGVRLAEEPQLVEIGARRLLLAHGDALCTGDAAYQTFRRRVRARAWIETFLARPLEERRREIERLRARSEAQKQCKPAAIMDVNGPAVEALLRRYGYPTLIHGHTHRPDRHEHAVDGRRCERWVLGAWQPQANWLAAGPAGLARETLGPLG